MTGPLLERCREVVKRFDAFFSGIVQGYRLDPGAYADLLPEELLTAPLAAEPPASPFPISRLDCVLTESGEVRVIEINPVGVCALHLRSVSYLARALARAGLIEASGTLDRLDDELVAAFARFQQEIRARSTDRPSTIGVLTLRNMHRGSRVMWRQVFERRGWRFVDGCVDEVELLPEGLALKGVPLDLLWSDFLIYLGYQQTRYAQTRFASRMAAFDHAAPETARLLSQDGFLDRLRTRRIVNMSPFASYLAISKHLLSLIHRPDRPVNGERTWLAAHVARTYAAVDRTDGTISVGEARRERERLLLKPCRYGGAHGVSIGHLVSPGDWARRLDEIWTDPEWVLQEFHAPCRTADGQYVSLGLHNHSGRLGAVTVRTAAQVVISARESTFIPVVAE
jgi:hypothetical protein